MGYSPRTLVDKLGLKPGQHACFIDAPLNYLELLRPAGIIWVSWPKKTAARALGIATDLTEDVVRGCALPLGLVDVKVCAVDEVWSGLRLCIRRELR